MFLRHGIVPFFWRLILIFPLTRIWFRFRYRGQEWFEVFDSRDRIVTTAPRKICHNRTFLRHRSVHLLVRDRAGRILLQKRSAEKDIQPGRWDTSVGGHGNPGETPLQALIRETREEISLDLDYSTAVFLYDYEWISSREREWVHTYVHETDRTEFVFDRHEIEAVRFWTPEEIRASLGTGVFTSNFEHEYARWIRHMGEAR